MQSINIRKLLLILVAGLFLMGAPVIADQGKININTASQSELCGLKRVGQKYAARIVEYRQKIGEFKSPEEIMNVRGIGRKTFEANKDVIIVREATAEVAKSE